MRSWPPRRTLRDAAPALADAAAMVGDPAVRNRGTIGGNIAHADPASDLPTVLVALDARMVAAGPGGERTIPAERVLYRDHDDRADGRGDPDGDPGAGVRPGQGSAYEKFAHPASRYAVLGAAACVTVTNGTCSAARIALGGLLPNARRAPAAETRADRQGAHRRDDCGGGGAGGRGSRQRRERATSLRRPNTAPRWRRCSRSARWPTPRRAPR